MNCLRELYESGRISMQISEKLINEQPKGHGSMRETAYGYLFLGGEELTPVEIDRWNQLRIILFPHSDKLTDRQRADVQQLFDHDKYRMSL